MTDREKAIRILEGNYKGFVLRYNGELLTVNELIALLKAQTARVMTLEEIHDIYHYREDHVWPFDTPPYLWMEVNPNYRNVIGGWVSWSNIIDCLEGRSPYYLAEGYKAKWVCWTSRPTDAQMMAAPWKE